MGPLTLILSALAALSQDSAPAPLRQEARAFVLVHAVLWGVALNTFAGFRALSPTPRMVGQNYGLSSVGYIVLRDRDRGAGAAAGSSR